MSDKLHALQVAGGIVLALPSLLSALIVFFKTVPGDQPEKFLEDKIKPSFDKILHFYGLVTKKNE